MPEEQLGLSHNLFSHLNIELSTREHSEVFGKRVAFESLLTDLERPLGAVADGVGAPDVGV